MFHSFQTSIAGIELPRLFTYPSITLLIRYV